MRYFIHMRIHILLFVCFFFVSKWFFEWFPFLWQFQENDSIHLVDLCFYNVIGKKAQWFSIPNNYPISKVNNITQMLDCSNVKIVNSSSVFILKWVVWKKASSEHIQATSNCFTVSDTDILYSHTKIGFA